MILGSDSIPHKPMRASHEGSIMDVVLQTWQHTEHNTTQTKLNVIFLKTKKKNIL